MGSITIRDNQVSFKVYYKDLAVLIDHFDNYPLITKKRADYELFKRALELINRQEHLTPEGLMKIVSIKASMNKGLSEDLQTAFPNVTPVSRPIVDVATIPDPNQTIDREQYYLDLLKPEYNILSVASSSLGKHHSEETKSKISNTLKGKSLSEETKVKMSITRTGKIFSDETKNKLSELRRGKPSPFAGKTHSDETRKKMSEGIGSKVEVFNKDTLETKIYPSNIKAAEALACSESTIRYYLKNSKPFKGKYFVLRKKKIAKV